MTYPGGYTEEPALGTPGASLGPRVVARIIDGILVGLTMSVILIPLVFGSIFDDIGTTTGIWGGSFSFGSILASIVAAGVVIGYFTLMESSRGQTVGKMIMNLRTVGPTGGTPTPEQAFKRSLFYALSIIPVFGGALQLVAIILIMVSITNNDMHIGYHDEFAGGTKVIKISGGEKLI